MTIKVLSTHALAEVLHELTPVFERKGGQTLSFAYNPSAEIRREIDKGAALDVAIVTKSAISDLAEQGRIISETCQTLARCGLGLAVRAGAPRPDISTVDSFRRALLAATSVVRSKDGVSGQHFEALLTRLGIAEAMRGKIVIGPAGRVAELVARGEAEMAVQQVPELIPVAGTVFVGPLPDELQLYTEFAAGVAAASTQSPQARQFVEILTAPAAAAIYRAKGLEPAVR